MEMDRVGVVREVDFRHRDGRSRRRPWPKIEAKDRAAIVVLDLVAEARGLSSNLLMHPSRGMAAIASARQLAMYLVHVLLGRTLTEVGRLFGRDRTTVAHACTLIEDRRDEAPLEREIEDIERRFAEWQCSEHSERADGTNG